MELDLRGHILGTTLQGDLACITAYIFLATEELGSYRYSYHHI